jgi:predicted outer membrane repeat protein
MSARFGSRFRVEASRVLGRALVSALFFASASSGVARAADAVVGNGMPASCDEAALDAAVLAVTSGGGGTMTFACGPSPHTILVTTEKVLFGDVTLQGEGRITLSGGLGTRILHTLTPSHVFLDGITLAGGFANAGGGAIFVDGTGTPSQTRLYLQRTRVRDSVSTQWGGGIGAVSATLSIALSEIDGNSSGLGGGGVSMNFGTLQIVESRFAGNEAAGHGAALEFWNGELTMNGGYFFDNATDAVGDDASGGALSLRNLPIAAIEDSVFSGNRAELAGGAIYAWGTTELTISRTEISRNAVPAGAGGGVLLAGSATMEMRDSTVAGNLAVQGGGIDASGGFAITNSTISGNRATGGTGGGIASSVGFEMVHVTLSRNQATSGGALWYGGFGGSPPQAYNLLFSDNSATAGPASCQLEAPFGLLAFSLWPDTSCGSSGANGNQPSTVVTLPPLAKSCADPAERTPTHALPAGAAVDSGSCFLPSLALDHRGVARPQGAGCDVGAVERTATPSCGELFRDGFENGTAFRWSGTAYGS